MFFLCYTPPCPWVISSSQLPLLNPQKNRAEVQLPSLRAKTQSPVVTSMCLGAPGSPVSHLNTALCLFLSLPTHCHESSPDFFFFQEISSALPGAGSPTELLQVRSPKCPKSPTQLPAKWQEAEAGVTPGCISKQKNPCFKSVQQPSSQKTGKKSF